MTDICQYLPKQSKTVAAIFAHYKKVGDDGHMSKTLPVSLIGHPCERYLWYVFRQCCKPEFSGRMYRLFETGQLEEARFVKNLQSIGCVVETIDEETDKQFRVLAFGGHLKGYMDGCALGIPEAPKTWHVLEFKTHNAKSFRELVKKGVKGSKPQHYAQMMIEMHLTGMKRALYLVRNKDDDDLYSERIRYSKKEGEMLMERAERVITAVSPPDRISNRPDFYQCNWCDAQEICWGTDTVVDAVKGHGSVLLVPSFSCRHCCHATPVLTEEDSSEWRCDKTGKYFVGEGSLCTNHLLLPGLISFAEPTDYGQDEEGKDFIEFTNKDGTTWKTGPAYGCYSSEELMKIPVSLLANEMIRTAKNLFGSTVIKCEKDILSRYPEEDSRIIWKGKIRDLAAAWHLQYGDYLTKLKPIARFCNLPEYDSAELESGRVVIVWGDGTAEIRERVE